MLDRLGAALARTLDVPLANPAFPLTHAQAIAERTRMVASPVALARPVLVIGGWRAWPFMAQALAAELRTLTGAPADRFASTAFPFCTDMAEMARRTVALVDQRWPVAPGEPPTQIDVVGISMGGLIARAAAAGLGTPHPLRIARLFTLGTPHRGASLAQHIAIDAPARAMRPGSAYLTALDTALAAADYELFCYARLRDTWVGAERTAPPQMHPRWVSGTRVLSHISIASDPRLVVEIARTLRGEAPLSTPSPPPKGGA